MELKVYDELPNEAKKIRTSVFINEQGFKNEFDEIDDTAIHLVLFDDGKPIAVSRIYKDKDETEKTWHIGRVAVVKEYRGKGFGKIVMLTSEHEAQRLGARIITVSAQVSAKKFYKSLGYSQKGEEYYDEHCLHIDMTKRI